MGLARKSHLRHKFLIDTWAGRLAASLPVGPRTQDSSNFENGLAVTGNRHAGAEDNPT